MMTTMPSFLVVTFKYKPGKPLPECLHSGFYWSERWCGGDNRSYKTCKAL